MFNRYINSCSQTSYEFAEFVIFEIDDQVDMTQFLYGYGM